MQLDDRSPVLVGVAAASQHDEDPTGSLTAGELMIRAARNAAEDAGCPALPGQLDSVRVPRGFWSYTDPGRLVADGIGAKRAQSVLVEIGVLQQTILSAAFDDILAGREEAVLVVGGEARYRDLRAGKLGLALPETEQAGSTPDRVISPGEEICHPLEGERGLLLPVRAFAVMESALRFDEGLSLDAHRAKLASLGSGFSHVAAENPDAWSRDRVTPQQLLESSAANRMLAFPYTRRLSSDWNVDQAAALLLCSVRKARELEIPRERWVFPLAATECNHVVTLAARPELHRCPGAKLGGQRLLDLAGLAIGDLDHCDLYSCFPAATRIFARELGLSEELPWTVTGGMAFAGGPLNNYVLQSSVCMARRLRRTPREIGLVTGVSGLLNKVGFTLWSCTPSGKGFAFCDVSAEAAAETQPREILDEYDGDARVVGYTVTFSGERPSEVIAICESPAGKRCIVTSNEPSLAALGTERELCGVPVRVEEGRHFELRES